MRAVMFWTSPRGRELYYTGRDPAGRIEASPDLKDAATWPTLRAAYESTACGRCKECEGGHREKCLKPFAKLQRWRVGWR